MRAVIGPNGAGTTTIMDIVTGKTTSGIVTFGSLADQFYVHRRGSVALQGSKSTLSRDTVRAEVPI